MDGNSPPVAVASDRLPCAEVERIICDVWSELFETDVSPYDDFFDLGGDSITMIDMVHAARLRGIAVRSSVALRNPTPARLAESLTVRSGRPVPERGFVAPPAGQVDAAQPHPEAAGEWADVSALVGTGTTDRHPPLFVLHSHEYLHAERAAIGAWGAGRAVAEVRAPGAWGAVAPFRDIGDLAGRYRTAISRRQPEGPYRLVGFGHSAVVAFELARQLRDGDGEVALLAMVDPPALPGPAVPAPTLDAILRDRSTALARRFGLDGTETLQEVRSRMLQANWYDPAITAAELPRLELAWAQLARLVHGYQPGRYDGPVLLFGDDSHRPATEAAWCPAVAELRAHWTRHGVAARHPLLRDRSVTDVLRAELAR
ncbi:thioesterase domain-containing protein [Plantactinospora sp. WMMC1484]|uniref:thioesterase domain-containing protein n=1 Tax=Plantactinospora sp. WMMC1484 TaxID=3404122 RepID=UPI003BF51E48